MKKLILALAIIEGQLADAVSAHVGALHGLHELNPIIVYFGLVPMQLLSPLVLVALVWKTPDTDTRTRFTQYAIVIALNAVAVWNFSLLIR